MATADSVKNKIQGLINTANATTGKADTDLTSAVGALIAGFGQGGGVELPELSNPGSATDLMSGKELIDGDGNVVAGTMVNNGDISRTMDGISVKTVTIPEGYTTGGTVSLDDTIDNEVNTQADLITQIQTALQGKAAGGGNEGGQVITEGWQRPSNWPDLSSLGRPEPGIVYLTYDCRSTIDGSCPGFISIICNTPAKLYRGRIENGTFIEVAEVVMTQSKRLWEYLPDDEGEFIVYKLDDTNGYGWAFTNYDIAGWHWSTQPCVEIYGAANGNKGSLNIFNSYSGLAMGTKAITIYGNEVSNSFVGGLYSIPIATEYINIEDWILKEGTTFGSHYARNMAAITSLGLPWEMTVSGNTAYAFAGNTFMKKLDISKLDTSNSTSMQNMFDSCRSLESLDISHFVTTSVTNFNNMFNACTVLYSVDFSGLDTTACTATTLTMFNGCYNLTELQLGKITVSFKFSNCNALSHESLLNVIAALEPTTTAKTLTIGTKNLAKLTEAEIAVATEKGWTVA